MHVTIPTEHCSLLMRCKYDTSVCMTPSSTARDRLIDTATRLFAQHGYHGASVRTICDLARTNPGAVSYYFGGKRQLYRIVIRKAAVHLTGMITAEPGNTHDIIESLHATVIDAMEALTPENAAVRLLFRDLAEGGEGAAEAIAPLLRQAYEALLERGDPAAGPDAKRKLQASILRSLAPAFLVLTAWPVLARAFGLQPQDRRELVAACLAPTQSP